MKKARIISNSNLISEPVPREICFTFQRLDVSGNICNVISVHLDKVISTALIFFKGYLFQEALK